LVSRVVSSTCRPTDAREIDRNAFELLSSFDEIISLGYRENVNLAQVASISEMDSHEEKVQEMIEKVWTVARQPPARKDKSREKLVRHLFSHFSTRTRNARPRRS